MKKFANVQNNQIVQIIEMELSQPPFGWHECPEEITSENFLNFSFIDGQFVEVGQRPAYPCKIFNGAWVIDREQTLKLIGYKVDQERVMACGQPIEYDGNWFDADDVAVSNIQSTITFSQTVGIPQGFQWRTADNILVDMPAEKLSGLATAIFMRKYQKYQEAWAAKDSMSSFSDQDLANLYLSMFPNQNSVFMG